MDASAERCYRPLAFDKMEGLVREMQDPENGVPVRSQKLFLTSIPSAFMGYDLIEWLMERLGIEESEALNIANQMCQYGYFFPVSDSKNLVVKDDSSLYRFQPPYYWPWQQRTPDNVEYAIYLAKRTLRNKQRHGLEEYELESLTNLRKNLQNKWDFITLQAEEQVKLAKERKKGDKIVSDSQERAYWRVYRPPPGFVSSLEQCPVPNRPRNGTRPRRRTLEDCRREVDLLKNSLSRTRVKVSQALDGMLQYVDTYAEYDPLISGTQPSNPWVSEDLTYWQLNSPLVEMPTEKRVRRWSLSMEELVSDPTGLHEFTAYLRKEYSHENIRFWMEVNVLRRSSQSQIHRKVLEIFEEFLAPGAPCEINIDGKTMEKVHQELKQPSRFTFDAAAEHVYTLLLKKDCYPRFIRSEHYKSLVASGIQPSHKKRFFGFGPTKKKTSTTSAPNPSLLQQQPTQGSAVGCGALSRRRGSDRSLSGSAHELAISGVRDSSRVPHSHSQSNLSDIPYRGDLPCQNSKRPTATWQNLEPEPTPSCGICPWDEPSSTSESEVQTRVKKPSIAVNPGASTSEDVCPWEATPPPITNETPASGSTSGTATLSTSATTIGSSATTPVNIDELPTNEEKASPNKSALLQRMNTSSMEQERPKYLDKSPGALNKSAGSFERISEASERSDHSSDVSELSFSTTERTGFDRTPGSTERLLQRPSDRNERPSGFDRGGERNAERTAERIAERVSERNAERSRQAAAALDKSTEKLSDKSLEVRSRKNSAQFDSGSSSSDISLAIAEVSDRFRRNYGLATQLTLDGDNRTKKLTTTTYEVRRASVSIPTKFSSSSSSNEGRPSVSSFEDVTANSIDNNAKAFKKSQSLSKTNSVTGISAPIISVSSIVDDVIVDLEEPTGCYRESSTMVIMAPLAVPDSESPCSEIAPELPVEEPNLPPLIIEPDEDSQVDDDDEAEAIAVPQTDDTDDRGITSDDKDICPWEDEETCKVDSPFVKTYATLGYL